MNKSYEAKIIREGDSFIFDFPLEESFELAHDRAIEWISDNQIKLGDDGSYFICHEEKLVKIIQ